MVCITLFYFLLPPSLEKRVASGSLDIGRDSCYGIEVDIKHYI